MFLNVNDPGFWIGMAVAFLVLVLIGRLFWVRGTPTAYRSPLVGIVMVLVVLLSLAWIADFGFDRARAWIGNRVDTAVGSIQPEDQPVDESKSSTATTSMAKSNEKQAADAAPTANGEPEVEVISAIVANTCPTTASVQLATGVHVVHVDSEPCAFTWRGYPVATILATCPEGYVCTFHVWNDDIVVHEGIGQQAQISAATWRWMGAYPSEDVCVVYNGEAGFGAREVNSFKVRFQPVPNGVQSCTGAWLGDSTESTSATSVTESVEQQPALVIPTPTKVVVVPPTATAPAPVALVCPTFGAAPTVLGNDGSDYCKYNGSVVTASVPVGFTAEYWDGAAVQFASGGQTITTATATFRPQ